MTRHTSTAVLVGLLTLVSAPSGADEMVQVTSGSIEFVGGANGHFVFRGDTFMLSGALDPAGISPRDTHDARVPGETFAVRNFWAGSDVRTSPTTVAVVGGVPYDPIYFLDFGSVSLTSGPYVVPATGTEMVTIQAPFTLDPDSRIYGFQSQLPFASPSDAVFRFGLFGWGTVTSTLRLYPGTSTYFHAHSLFRFSREQPAPTPEPGSLLLLGTALAGIVAARRRRGHMMRSR